MAYKTEVGIFEVVRGFETATIPRDKWRHAEHLTVALFYLVHHDFEFAANKMRNGILHYLKIIGVDLEKENPYHETITLFWMRMVSSYLSSKNKNSIVELTNGLLETCSDKDLPLKFYSRELLFSDNARKEFVQPDLREF